MSKKIKPMVFKIPALETVSFISLTALVPKKWNKWFYNAISSDAPFSWGDNDRTLVTASRLADHAEEVFDTCQNISSPVILFLTPIRVIETDSKAFVNMLRDLGETYIDLEN